MFRILSLFLLLPLFEIIGFIVIGGSIGLLRSILWLVASSILGSAILRARRENRWRQAESADAVFTSSSLFDDISLTIGASLLLFPGFISDFFAIPFLIAPLRQILFRHMNNHPENFLRRTTRSYWTDGRQEHQETEKTTTIIDGDFRRLDE